MTAHQSTPEAAVLVAIDIAKHRDEILIQEPGRYRFAFAIRQCWRLYFPLDLTLCGAGALPFPPLAPDAITGRPPPSQGQESP